MAKRTGPTPIQRSRSKRPSEKATYHQITGAGRSKVQRKFFGLSPTDQAVIEEEVGLRLEINLQSERSA